MQRTNNNNIHNLIGGRYAEDGVYIASANTVLVSDPAQLTGDIDSNVSYLSRRRAGTAALERQS